jgi:hypothetical protein
MIIASAGVPPIVAEWRVQLEGQRLDLLDLEEQVHAHGISIIHDENTFDLRAKRFEACANAEEVQQVAQDLLPLLNGSASANIAGFQPATLGPVMRVADNGDRQAFFLVSGAVTLRGPRVRGEIKVASGPRVEPTQPATSPIDTAINCAVGDPEVHRALQLYGALAHTWRNLYLVLEVIEGAVGGQAQLAAKGWVTAASIGRFKGTANSFQVVGAEARHGSTIRAAPSKTMTLSDADALMATILRSWLKERCRQD